MARLVIGEYRGFGDKSGTLDNGNRWAHRRINLEDEAGDPFFVKITEDRVQDFRLPAKGERVAYLVDQYDRVQRQLPEAAELASYLGLDAA